MGQKGVVAFLSASRATADLPLSSVPVNTQAAYALTFSANITVASTTSITFTIQGLDEAGTWYTLLASAAQTATGRVNLTIGPGTPAVANVSANQVLPLQVRCTVSGTATATTFYGRFILTNSLPS